MPGNARDLMDELERLALRLAEDISKANAAPPESRPRFLVFRAGGVRCRLAVSCVREVLLPLPLSRVPRAPDAVLGVMNLRGRVVPVVELSKVLAGVHASAPATASGGAEDERDVRFLLMELAGREVGARVEAVEGIDHDTSIAELQPGQLVEAIEALVA